jgi:hypothetical protein
MYSLGAGIVSEDLPVVLGNPLHFKRDSGFAHANEYGSFGPDGKPNVRGGLALARGLTAAIHMSPRPQCPLWVKSRHWSAFV